MHANLRRCGWLLAAVLAFAGAALTLPPAVAAVSAEAGSEILGL